MNQIARAIFAGLAIFACMTWAAAASTDGRAIDGAHSSLKVRVNKTGFFSAFAHNHEIEAPIESGEVAESGTPSVKLRVDARKMRVLDPEASADTRAQVQKTMLGPQVLDTERFPEIQFQSTEVEAKGTDHWLVHGTLDLHGQSHPVTVDVALKDGVYRGTATLKQSGFGITPVSVGGGTVKVKDEVKVEFEIALVK
ncbi:MAG TPA: YceI family protein [Candidatus Acidoferrum sp.]|nr:YceI family protein [Candidatus Acidoferrum sp.]